MFAYPDAARYRLGVNYQQLPSNRAHVTVYNPYERDGRARIDGNYGSDPDYIRSELRPVSLSSRHSVPTHEHWNGKVQIYSTGVTEKDFEQPKQLYALIQKEGTQDQFVSNISATLVDVEPSLRDQVYGKLHSRQRHRSFRRVLTSTKHTSQELTRVSLRQSSRASCRDPAYSLSAVPTCT
jgi:catalase